MASTRSVARVLLTLAALVALGGLVFLLLPRTVKLRLRHKLTQTGSPPPEEPDRIGPARARVEGELRQLCTAAGLPYPPPALFLRAFKQEAELEIWGGVPGQPFQLLATYPVTYSPGLPGPKRKEGDRQVPEGFYTIDLLNPKSLYHLSLRVNYPNASDLVLSDQKAPGSDIYLHGGNGSVGCLPLGDENIEKLFILALDSTGGGKPAIPIHIFPMRMEGWAWEGFKVVQVEKQPGLMGFWNTLKLGYDAFEKAHCVPQITVEADGRYRVEP